MASSRTTSPGAQKGLPCRRMPDGTGAASASRTARTTRCCRSSPRRRRRRNAGRSRIRPATAYYTSESRGCRSAIHSTARLRRGRRPLKSRGKSTVQVSHDHRHTDTHAPPHALLLPFPCPSLPCLFSRPFLSLLQVFGKKAANQAFPDLGLSRIRRQLPLHRLLL